MRIVKAVVSADRKECAVYLDNGEKLEGVLAIEVHASVDAGATVKVEARLLVPREPAEIEVQR